jgi:putative ABC transport system permease protein
MKHTTLRMAWRNLGRNRRRTLLALGAIALGQLTLVFVNCLMAGSYNQMLDTITGPLIGHVQIHHVEWREERALDLYIDNVSDVVSQLQASPDVEAVLPRIYAPALAASGEQSERPADAEPAVVIGVDTVAERAEDGMLDALPLSDVPGDGGVIVGKVLANRLGVTAGEQLAIIGQDIDGFPTANLYRIRAIIESQLDLVESRGIVMGIDEARTLLAMPNQAHEIVVRGDDYRRAPALAEQVSALDALSETEVLPWRELVPALARLTDMKSWVDVIFVGIVFVAAAAGIANTAMMSTFERTHEFGMLLALGTAPRRIVRMVLVESVLLGFIGVTVGSIIGTAAVLTTSATGIDYGALAETHPEDVAFGGISFSFIVYPQFELRHVIFGVVAVTVTSVIAATWPALLAARLEPVEAMRS